MKKAFQPLIESKEELFHYINEETIYNYYFDNIYDNMWIKSPFRPNENTPSFRISYHNNKWLWTDFGESVHPNDIIELVKKIENLNYIEALNFIFNNIYNNNSVRKINKINIQEKEKTKSFCSIRNLNYEELDYWKKLGIEPVDLKKFKVYSGYILNDGKLWGESKKDNPLFIYMFDIKNEIYKGYKPYESNKKLKFFANNINNHIQGYDLLPETGDILIITKSYKDVMIWNKLGYPAIAPHTESMFINNDILCELKQRFKYIYVNYDNDLTGVTKCTQFTKENDLCYFNLPKSTNAKDPSDFISLDINNYKILNRLLIDKITKDGKLYKK